MPVKPELCILFKVQRIWKDLFLCNINIFLLNYGCRGRGSAVVRGELAPERAVRVRALARDIVSVVFLTPYSHSGSLHPEV